MNTKRYDLISGLFWLLCSAFIVIGALHLPVGTVGDPGPGFVPFLVGILLSIISLAILIYSFFQRPSEGKVFWPDKKQWPKVVTTVLMILIYTIAFPYLGFFVSTLLLMFFLFKAIGGMKLEGFLGRSDIDLILFLPCIQSVVEGSIPWGAVGDVIWISCIILD